MTKNENKKTIFQLMKKEAELVKEYLKMKNNADGLQDTMSDRCYEYDEEIRKLEKEFKQDKAELEKKWSYTRRKLYDIREELTNVNATLNALLEDN